jgi:hypothetical protein
MRIAGLNARPELATPPSPDATEGAAGRDGLVMRWRHPLRGALVGIGLSALACGGVGSEAGSAGAVPVSGRYTLSCDGGIVLNVEPDGRCEITFNDCEGYGNSEQCTVQADAPGRWTLDAATANDFKIHAPLVADADGSLSLPLEDADTVSCGNCTAASGPARFRRE